MTLEPWSEPKSLPAVDRRLLLRLSDELLDLIEERRLRGDPEERTFNSGRVYTGLRQLWAATGFRRPAPRKLASCYEWLFQVQAECLLIVDEEAA